MKFSKILAFVAATLGASLIFAQPAQAGRTVIDSPGSLIVSGYCSPQVAASAPGCAPVALPFSVTVGGNTFNSVFVNSNGTLSFNSIAPQLALQNSFSGDPPSSANYTGPAPATSLSAYAGPIFSPYFSDGPGYVPQFTFPQGFDGNLASSQLLTGNSLTVNFFACTNTINCGTETIRLFTNAVFDPSGISALTQVIMNYNPGATDFDLANFEVGRANALNQFNSQLNIYTMILAGTSDGFTVDYRYNPAATGDIGTSGFNLAGGLNETTAPLADRSFRFVDGQLVTGAVPEPSTWAMMLLGFGAVGVALRRRKAGRQPKAA